MALPLNPGKDKANQVYFLIRKILWEDWDPIGVNEFPVAEDEYDSYIPDVTYLLESGANLSKLVDYLSWVRTDRMGLFLNPLKDKEVAEKLIAAYSALMSES